MKSSKCLLVLGVLVLSPSCTPDEASELLPDQAESDPAVKEDSESDALEPWELPLSLEIQLAESAAPPAIRKDAGIWVYNPRLHPDTGYYLHRPGTNGFQCLVGRTDIYLLPFIEKKEFRDDILIPVCYDKLGEDIVRDWLSPAELRLKHKMSAAEVVEALEKRVKSTPPSFSPMISPFIRTYAAPPSSLVANFNYPHYMYYSPDVLNEDIFGTFGDTVWPWVAADVVYEAKHAHYMQAVGLAERIQINVEYEDMVHQLCEAHEEYCHFLVSPTGQEAPLTFDELNDHLRKELKKLSALGGA